MRPAHCILSVQAARIRLWAMHELHRHAMRTQHRRELPLAHLEHGKALRQLRGGALVSITPQQIQESST